MIDRIIEKMNLDKNQIDIIKQKEELILSKTKSIWTVVEDASEYAFQC